MCVCVLCLCVLAAVRVLCGQLVLKLRFHQITFFSLRLYIYEGGLFEINVVTLS